MPKEWPAIDPQAEGVGGGRTCVTQATWWVKRTKVLSHTDLVCIQLDEYFDLSVSQFLHL